MRKSLYIISAAYILLSCAACGKAAPEAAPAVTEETPPSCLVSTADGTSVEANWYDNNAPVDNDILPVLKAGDSDTLSFSVSWDKDTLTVSEDYYTYGNEQAGTMVYMKTYTLRKNQDGLFTLDVKRQNDVRDEQAVYYVVNGNDKFIFKVSLPLTQVERATYEIDGLKYMPFFSNVTADYFLELSAGTLIKIGDGTFSADTSAALASPVQSVFYDTISFTKEALDDTIDVIGDISAIDLSPYTDRAAYKVMVNNEDTGFRVYYLDDEVWLGHFSRHGPNSDVWWADYIFSLKPYAEMM